MGLLFKQRPEIKQILIVNHSSTVFLLRVLSMDRYREAHSRTHVMEWRYRLMCSTLRPQPLYPWRGSQRHPVHRRLCGHQTKSRRFWEEKIRCPFRESINDSLFVHPLSKSLYRLSNSGPMYVFAVDNFWSGSSGAFGEDDNAYLGTIELASC